MTDKGQDEPRWSDTYQDDSPPCPCSACDNTTDMYGNTQDGPTEAEGGDNTMTSSPEPNCSVVMSHAPVKGATGDRFYNWRKAVEQTYERGGHLHEVGLLWVRCTEACLRWEEAYPSHYNPQFLG